MLKELYEKNKILFYILVIVGLPLLILIAFKDIILKIIAGSANKLVTETKQKNEVLKAEQDKANSEANAHKEKADKLEAQANQAQKEDDSDWHKKGKVSLGVLAAIIGTAVVSFELYSAFINHVPRLKETQCVLFDLNEAKRLFPKETRIQIPVFGVVVKSDPIKGEYLIQSIFSQVMPLGAVFSLDYAEERRLTTIQKADTCEKLLEGEQ